jgi:hypothetical protein
MTYQSLLILKIGSAFKTETESNVFLQSSILWARNVT